MPRLLPSTVPWQRCRPHRYAYQEALGKASMTCMPCVCANQCFARDNTGRPATASVIK